MTLVDWSTITDGCVLLDIWGNLFLELGHKGFHVWFHNTSWITLLFRQSQLYAELVDRMIHHAVCAPPDDLLGGFHFTYKRKAGMLVPYNVALLSRRAMDAKGLRQRNPAIDAVRAAGFERLWQTFDQIAQALQAKLAFMSSAPIPEDKLVQYGCVPYAPTGWLKYYFALFAFPYRHQKHFVKLYK